MTDSQLHDVFYRFPRRFPLPFVLDGSTGTALSALGMTAGDCPEAFVLANPDRLRAVQTAYAAAGSDAVYTPTFGANAPTLARHGLTADGDFDAAARLNRALAAVSVENPGRPRFIGGDMSPTGLLLKPYGDADFEDVVKIYKNQAAALIAAGADFIAAETQIALAETRAAVIAVRELSPDMPVFATMTVGADGKTMSGDSLDACLVALADLGICAFGCNCSTGPSETLAALEKIVPLAAALGVAVIAKPNAGMPVETERGTEFRLSAEEFSAQARLMLGAGITVLGGCCGTTDAHIAAIRRAVSDTAVEIPADIPTDAELYVSNARQLAKRDPGAEYNAPVDDPDDIADLADEADGVLYLTVETEKQADAALEAEPYISVPLAVRGDEVAVARLRRCWIGKCY